MTYPPTEWVNHKTKELPCSPDEERARQDVLEAHKLLVELNPKCETEFIDLIRYLEDQASA